MIRTNKLDITEIINTIIILDILWNKWGISNGETCVHIKLKCLTTL